jgi:uncharacterized membrane protein
MITVTLYTRQDCQPCEQIQVDLQSLQEEVPHQLKVVDVDTDAKLRKAYGEKVPVVEVGPYLLKAPLTRQDLMIALKAAEHGIRQNEEIDRAIREERLAIGIPWTKADRFTYWMSKHYLGLFNILVFIYVGLAFLAPVLMKARITTPAKLLYRGYSLVCHQLGYRSWFLFGKQPFYPRQAAGIKGYITFEEATALDPMDLWTSREFVGDATYGYKVALCQRDVAIYLAILFFGLLFAVLRRKVPHMPPIRWYVWVLVGIVPMGLDGGTQLLSQFFPWFTRIVPYRESTPFLRTLTGGLFGLTTAWFGYPMVEESMSETRRYLEKRMGKEKSEVEAGGGSPQGL